MNREFSSAVHSASRRLVKERPTLALMAAQVSGERSFRPTDHAGVVSWMAMEFIRAGWKPRLRVKAGRREWSLPCPA